MPGSFSTVRHDRGEDDVAIEEPLEIRVDGRPLAVTMRTPGHDEELALGFLYGEGLIDGPAHAGPTEDLGPIPSRSQDRCGASRASAASTRHPRAGSAARARSRRWPSTVRRSPRGLSVARSLVARLPDLLEQPTFERTGGLHATGLFEPSGALVIEREDVGRHNAMDKVVGRALLDGLLPLGERFLCVSGRLSFELVQKAAVAGAPILVGVGAPSSLAISLAADRGMTLCGFARAGR